MSTAAQWESRSWGPRLVKPQQSEAIPRIPGYEGYEKLEPPPVRTIHRITKTYHGQTLAILGHAAEHLADARRFPRKGSDARADAEAIHILMRLSREVFDDFADGSALARRAGRWVTDRIVAMIC